MTKKIVKIVSAALVLALGVSLAGCGKKDDTKSSVALDGAGEGYEFVATSKSINNLLKVSGSLNKVSVENGKVYAVENQNGKTVFHIADLETGEDKTFDLDLASVFPSDNSEETDSEPSDETKVEPAETEEPSEEGEASAEENQGAELIYSEEGVKAEYGGFDEGSYYFESYDSAYVNDIQPAKDGSVYIIAFKYENNKSHRTMCKLTAEGKFEKLYSFDDVVGEDEGISSLKIKEDGGVYVGVESKVVYVDNTGKTIGSVESGSWINNLFTDENGNCYAIYYGQNGQECKKADFATGQFGESLENGGIYGTPVVVSDQKVVVAGYDSVYEVNTETKEKTKLWDWVNLDVMNVDTNTFKVNSDGSYSLVSSDYTENGTKYEYTSIFKQAITPETARKDIIYGCTYLDYSLRQKIADFNKSQTEYRIRVKSYIDDSSDWNEEEYYNQL
ncbi:MAG: hypothetical protein IKZ39_03500, partial [Lachnospiraceae bacterium]|nr:hypothetical protein [Lachnospiraceae bacterium]